MARELAAGVWHLDLTGVNAYLLAGEELVLVDTGTRFDVGRIRAGLADAGCAVGDVDRVLITHFDLDHVGGLGKLPDLTAAIHMPAPDAEYLTGESRPSLATAKGIMHRISQVLVERPDQPVEIVQDGDEFGGVRAYRTPGHTPGHTAYVSADAGVAFLGDTVWGSNGSLSVTPWFMNENTDELKASIRSLDRRAPAFAVAAQGHGDPLASGGRRALAVLAESLR